MAGTTLFPSLITAASPTTSYSEDRGKKNSCLIYEENLRWQDFISLMYIHVYNTQEA